MEFVPTTPLPEETRVYLAGLLEIGDFVPATARPAVITATPPAPRPLSSAERIAAAVAGLAGLVQVQLDERFHPLWLRGATEDAAAALKSLGAVPKIPYTPRRILEIGAGAGYRSVALAHAWSQAEILTTESDPAFQRVALLNTLPYRNISAAFLTVSTDNARYGWSGRKGEAGRIALERDEKGTITATPLKNFLYSRGWNPFDTVIITMDSASDHLLRGLWPDCVRLIAVETGGAPLHEGTTPFFPDDKFLTEIEGDYVLLHRRDADLSLAPPRAVPVFNPEGPPQTLKLENVAAEPPGFFPIGAHGFRLHPNTSNAPVASLTLSHACRNYSELHLNLRVVSASSKPVRFSVTVSGPSETILSAAEVLQGGETRSAVLPLVPYNGPCEVRFITEMPGFWDSNAGAWAEVIAAAFV